MIITVMSNKGGVGKTTMATIVAELAFSYLMKGLKWEESPEPIICVCDFDRQHDSVDNLTPVETGDELKAKDLKTKRKSSAKQKVKEEDFLKYIKAYPMFLKDFDKERIMNFEQQYKYVVIDTPPSMDVNNIEELTQISDTIVLPFFTQGHEMRGMQKLIKVLGPNIKKCITVRLVDLGVIPEIIKIWYERFIKKYKPLIEGSKANFEIKKYVAVPKNLDGKDFFWKWLPPTSRGIYKDLWKKIIE